MLEHGVMESRQGKPFRGCGFAEIGFQPGGALHQGLWHSLWPTEHLRSSWGLRGAAKRIRSLVTTCVKSIPTAANGEGCQPLPSVGLCQTENCREQKWPLRDVGQKVRQFPCLLFYPQVY